MHSAYGGKHTQDRYEGHESERYVRDISRIEDAQRSCERTLKRTDEAHGMLNMIMSRYRAIYAEDAPYGMAPVFTAGETDDITATFNKMSDALDDRASELHAERKRLQRERDERAKAYHDDIAGYTCLETKTDNER